MKGHYATLITLFNGSTETVRFSKSFSRSLPYQGSLAPAGRQSGVVRPGEAIGVDCDEIRQSLPSPSTAELRMGTVNVIAEAELDVTATYSGRPVRGDIQTLDTARVTMRRLLLPPGHSTEGGICDAFNEASALIEGPVRDIRFTFDDVAGPREEVTIGVETVHAGQSPGESVVLRTMRGPIPDGSFVDWSETPVFERGGRYLLLLQGTSWFISPVVGMHAYQVVEIDGVEAVVDQAGFALNPNPPEAAFAPVAESQVAVRRQVLDRRFVLDLDNPESIHTPSAVLPGIDSSVLQNAYDAEGFARSLIAEARRCMAPFTGVFVDTPDPGRHWQVTEVMGSPQDVPQGPGCGETDPQTGEEVRCD